MPGPSIDQLQTPEFELLRALRHDDLIDFALEYFFRRPSWLIRLHHAMSIVCIVAIIAAAFVNAIGLWIALLQFLAATLTMFVVILPLHEALHAAAYWICGARRIRFGLWPRMLAAYVVAERFVANRAEFFFVALLPFFVINAALIFVAFVWPRLSVYFLSLLLWHVAGVSGDWALLNFYWHQRQREIFTYDDAERAYFYARVE